LISGLYYRERDTVATVKSEKKKFEPVARVASVNINFKYLLAQETSSS